MQRLQRFRSALRDLFGHVLRFGRIRPAAGRSSGHRTGCTAHSATAVAGLREAGRARINAALRTPG